MPRTSGILPLPSSTAALKAERARLERELAAAGPGPGRRLLALERRRVVIVLDQLSASS